MSIHDLLDRPATLEQLDQVADPIHARLTRVLDSNPAVAGLLRGDWLGHPVHPLAVTVPIGAWTSAVVLETALRDHRATRRLIGLGLVGVPFAAWTGWADWSARDTAERRAGLVHVAGIAVAVLAMANSLRLRKKGPSVRAELWSIVGLTAAGAAGALGAHISFGGRTVEQAAI